MVAPESVDQPRDERAYTPFFNLTAGVEYTISFYTNFDGYIIDGNPRGMTLDFTVSRMPTSIPNPSIQRAEVWIRPAAGRAKRSDSLRKRAVPTASLSLSPVKPAQVW